MHIKPKKSLGQNFLTDKNIRNKIIDSCGLKNTDTVLEIGAGRGEMTPLIAALAGMVFAVELDKGLLPDLGKAISGYRNVRIIKEDILKVDIASLAGQGGHKMTVIGNIPYYISSPIITRLIRQKDVIGDIFVTVQKEFAQRVAAVPGSKDYGSLSCFVRYYAEPKMLFTIKRNSFFPAPKVDSAFLHLRVSHEPRVKVNDEVSFFNLVRSSFNQRRKTLRSSLKGIVDAQALSGFFDERRMDPNTRPEGLSIEDFAALADTPNIFKKNP